MKISTLFMALLLGLTAMTACQNDAPQSATPPATTEEAKELYQKMADIMPFNPREKMGV